MKRRKLLFWAVFGVVVCAASAVLLFLFADTLGLPGLRQAVVPDAQNEPAASMKAAESSAQETPAAASSPAGFPPIEWSEAPPCENQPQPVQSLARAAQAQPGAAAPDDVRRARLLSPGLAKLDKDRVNSLMAADPSTDAGQQALLGLALNIATGRLNRETSVEFANLPEIQTAGDLLNLLEAGLEGGPVSPAALQAGQQLLNGQGITQPVCAHLLITQADGLPADVRWGASGIQAEAVRTSAGLQAAASGPGPVLDTVSVSPDGRWGAFTSLGNDSGGPLFITNLKSGDWTNLIDKMNANRPNNIPPLPSNGWWELIGWLPDSRRVILGMSDISAFFIVDIHTGKFDALAFNGNGLGGAQFAGLAADGSRLAYVEMSAAGDGQALTVYNLGNRKTQTLVPLPYSQGSLLYPRLAPDGLKLAYVVKKGTPEAGFSYAIHIYDLRKASTSVVVEGNLGLPVPTWSPDGQYLAFTRKNADEPDLYNPDKPLDQPAGNIWAAEISTGKLQQLTFINGIARRPTWASDARTLSFITHDGQVGLVNLNQPGQIWRAADQAAAQQGSAAQAAGAGQSQANALLVSAFFVP